MEVWKRSPLGPEHVEVSNLGRVRTLDRLAPSRSVSRGPQWKRGQVLSPWLGKVGYLFVAIKEGEKRPKYLVHRLVASAFCEGYAPGLSVNHIDGNKTNNAPENLEWVTLERNTALAWETGQCTPESHAQKLTPADVLAIRAKLAAGQSGNSIAKEYGVNSNLIYMIRDGQRWASVA